jgi:hypothetical protein
MNFDRQSMKNYAITDLKKKFEIRKKKFINMLISIWNGIEKRNVLRIVRK